MTDFETVGKQFVEHYYSTFDTGRANLGQLYAEGSMLTFENEQFLGSQNIMEKLNGLPSIKHAIITQDYQPTVNNGIIAFVTGQLAIDGSENGIPFSQIFHLQVGGQQGYYVHNDFFRQNTQ